MEVETAYYPTLDDIKNAAEILKGVSVRTPLQYSPYLSEKYEARVFLKREDLQPVRSYKIRGAYHKIASLTAEERRRGVVCASAGNHAQGFSFACKKMGIRGKVFMPLTTPKQKVEQVRWFGGADVEIVLCGDTFDDAYSRAVEWASQENIVFVHPFDDPKIIEGQGTVGLEIIEDHSGVDFLLMPVGGGGLSAGISGACSYLLPGVTLVGVEPEGAPAMKKSLEADEVLCLPDIDKFVDGAAVRKVGRRNFEICKQNLNDVLLVNEGKICQTILELYNREAIVVEPAGALAVAALDNVKEAIKGKDVVCVLSGGNNDITRMEEIKERAIIHQGLKHYFLVNFPQRAGALKEFVLNVLGPNDDITHFEYIRKNARPKGTALVGLELASSLDLQPLIERMQKDEYFEEYLNDKPGRMAFLI